jgi:hypothetical protein
MTFHIRKLTEMPRRTVLKGVGAIMGLPLLNGMLPENGLAAAAPDVAPIRMGFVFFPNGAIMPDWTPESEGTEYELSRTLKSLESVKSEFNVISGLAQEQGYAHGDGPGDHARSAATFLTGAHPVKTSGANISVGVSADQIAAEAIGKQTRLPSLEIGLERGRTAGNCDSGYSCAYSSTISWKTATTPMAKEINPRQVFERLFGSKGGTPEERAKKAKYRRSILDVVAGNAQKLRGQLGQTDKRKLDEYFSSVREIEQRIEQAQKSAELETPDFDIPRNIPGDLTEYMNLMYDLMILAYRTNSTRIITYMLANEGSNRSYPMVEVKSGHHQLSHHRGAKEKIADLQKIDEFTVKQFSRFLKRMKDTREGEGSLLDNSMIVLGSGLGDGNRHRHEDLPIVLAGKGGGTIPTGRHLRVPDKTPFNNLFLSMLHRVGANVAEFGDSTGELKQIDA